MSAATVSSLKRKGTKQNPAKWDDEKTRFLLEVFVEEINNGHRPAGVFTKQGWFNIVTKFNAKTGLGYNKDQLKNRQDNLRREFTRWNSLIGKEIGLGWDHAKRTLATPDSWWVEKAKTEPAILRYKDGGPLHLDLLQKVFGGTTANDIHATITVKDPLLDESDRLDNLQTAQELNDAVDVGDDGEDIGSEYDQATPSTVNPSSSKMPIHKRKRDSTQKRVSETDKFPYGMESLTQTMLENMMKFQRCNNEEESLTYKDALVLLKGVPGMGPHNPTYWKGVRILEDRVKRIAFCHVLEDGEEGVLAWLSTFPDNF